MNNFDQRINCTLHKFLLFLKKKRETIEENIELVAAAAARQNLSSSLTFHKINTSTINESRERGGAKKNRLHHRKIVICLAV
jgi:hypothetical protein